MTGSPGTPGWLGKCRADTDKQAAAPVFVSEDRGGLLSIRLAVCHARHVTDVTICIL